MALFSSGMSEITPLWYHWLSKTPDWMQPIARSHVQISLPSVPTAGILHVPSAPVVSGLMNKQATVCLSFRLMFTLTTDLGVFSDSLLTSPCACRIST